MTIKYSILIFQAPYKFKKFDTPFYFADKTFLKSDKLDSFFLDAETKHWEDWIGSIRWEEMTRYCDEVIVSWKETINPEILDAENNFLTNFNYELLRCLPAITPYSFSHSDHIYCLTGSGKLVSGEVKIESIRNFSSYPNFRKSFYLDTTHNYEDPFFDHDLVLNDWKSCREVIDKKIFNEKNRQLLEALRSMEESFRTSQLEFKIPHLVRVIESLIDCWGATGFSERVIWFIGDPPVENVFMIKTNFKKKLENIYQLRNDCSHGKPFAWSLQKNYPDEYSNESIAAYEFLIEWVARKVFSRALNDDSLNGIFKTRDSLVTAWSNYQLNIRQGP